MNALLGGIIGGAMEQGGKAYAKHYEKEADTERTMVIDEYRERMLMARQVRLEELRQSNNLATAKLTHGHRLEENVQADTLVGQRDLAKTGLSDASAVKTNQLAIDRDKVEDEARKAEGLLNRASSERIAGMQAANANKPVLMTLGDGTIVSVKDGKYAAVMDADGNVAKGQRDLDARTATLAKTYLEEMKAELDPAKKAEISAKIQQLLNPAAAPGAAPARTPTSSQISEFQRAYARDPSVAASYGKTFGQSALDEAIKSGKELDLTKPGGKGGIVEDAAKPGFADPMVLSPEDKKLQADVDRDRAAAEEQTRKSREARAVTIKAIQAMSPDEAQALLSQYGEALSGAQKAAVNAKLRR